MFVMSCAIVAFLSIVSLYCVLAYWFGSDLDPMVLVIISTPWPISKGLNHSICMSMLACLLICFMLVLASLVLGFAMLNALSGFVVVWLRPTPMRPCLGVTTSEASSDARLLHAYFSPFSFRAMIYLPCLFALPVGFLYIFTRDRPRMY